MSRADLHCHSSASEVSKLGVQRAIGLPECATPPEEVYALAKRRGMDFVTITDHDTIAGVLSSPTAPTCSCREELTARFRGEPQAVHVLCLGITPGDHEWLQAHAGDVETVAAYLHEHEIACALAHPFYAVAAPLDAPPPAPPRRALPGLGGPQRRPRPGAQPAGRDLRRHARRHRRRRLRRPRGRRHRAHLVRDAGGRHAGGVPRARARRPRRRLGDQGSAAKWAHAAMALAVRALGRGDDDAPPDPAAVLRMVERVHGRGRRPRRRRWRRPGTSRRPRGPPRLARGGGARHGRGRPARPPAVGRVLARRARAPGAALPRAQARGRGARVDGPARPPGVRRGVLEACVAAVPYAPAAAFLGREKDRVTARDGEPVRVGVVADGLGAVHGVSRTLAQVRERGVPGFEVEVIGTDASVDRRLTAVAEVEVPFYPGLTVGVPSAARRGRRARRRPVRPPARLHARARRRRRRCSPRDCSDCRSPAPTTPSSRPTRRCAPATRWSPPACGWRSRPSTASAGSSSPHRERPTAACSRSASTRSGSPAGTAASTLERFSRAHRRDRAPTIACTSSTPGASTEEKGAGLLADAFLAARARDPRLHLLLAGGGPEEVALRERLGRAATFLGWLEGGELASAYASADLFLFCSQTDTFGQVVLEAQASGLPVVASRPAALPSWSRTAAAACCALRGSTSWPAR